MPVTVAPIVVEDGTGIATANSYVSVATLRQYAANIGATVPDADNDCSVLLLKAMRYFVGKAWISTPFTATQALAWPRIAYVNGVAVASLPANLLQAQCELACTAATGVDLAPVSVSTGNLKKKIRGPITDEYFAPNQAGAGSQPHLPTVDALLAPLLGSSSNAVGALRVVRG